MVGRVFPESGVRQSPRPGREAAVRGRNAEKENETIYLSVWPSVLALTFLLRSLDCKPNHVQATLSDSVRSSARRMHTCARGVSLGVSLTGCIAHGVYGVYRSRDVSHLTE